MRHAPASPTSPCQKFLLTFFWELLLFAFLLHLLAPGVHAARLGLQESEEAVSIPEAHRRGSGLLWRSVHAHTLQGWRRRRKGGRVQSLLDALRHGERGFLCSPHAAGTVQRLSAASGANVLRRFTVHPVLSLGVGRLLSGRHAAEAAQPGHTQPHTHARTREFRNKVKSWLISSSVHQK